MCNNVFEKVTYRAGKVNSTSVYAGTTAEGFFKKGVMKNFG